MHELTVRYSPRVLASPPLRDTAERESGRLKDRIGLSLDPVTAEWDVATDAAGNDLLTLSLADFSGRVTAAFEPDEFESRGHVEKRLSRLYQDLLGIRTRKLLAAFAESYRGGEE